MSPEQNNIIEFTAQLTALVEMFEEKPYSPPGQLTQPINASATTIHFENVTEFEALPDGPNYAVLGVAEDSETVIYASKTGMQLNGVIRGVQRPGEARSWPAGTVISRNITALDFKAIRDNITNMRTSTMEAFNSLVTVINQALTNVMKELQEDVSNLEDRVVAVEAALETQAGRATFRILSPSDVTIGSDSVIFTVPAGDRVSLYGRFDVHLVGRVGDINRTYTFDSVGMARVGDRVPLLETVPSVGIFDDWHTGGQSLPAGLVCAVISATGITIDIAPMVSFVEDHFFGRPPDDISTEVTLSEIMLMTIQEEAE